MAFPPVMDFQLQQLARQLGLRRRCYLGEVFVNGGLAAGFAFGLELVAEDFDFFTKGIGAHLVGTHRSVSLAQILRMRRNFRSIAASARFNRSAISLLV